MIHSAFFAPEDYDLLEKWYGLLFAGEFAKHKPTDNDKKLLAKITMLHLIEAETEQRIKDMMDNDG